MSLSHFGTCTRKTIQGSITRAYMYYHDCSISITIRRLSHQDESRQQAKTALNQRGHCHADPHPTDVLNALHEGDTTHSRTLGSIDVAVCQQFISQIVSSRLITSSGTVPFTTLYAFPIQNPPSRVCPCSLRSRRRILLVRRTRSRSVCGHHRECVEASRRT